MDATSSRSFPLWAGIATAVFFAGVFVVALMYTGAALSVGDWAPWSSKTSIPWGAIARLAVPLAALAAAVVAAVIAVYGHQTRLDELALSRDSDVTDRYTKAVEQLGQESAVVKIGGIYALERIHRESPLDRDTIWNLLHTYADMRAPSLLDGVIDNEVDPALEACLQVLGRTSGPSPPVRLRDRSLRRINLTGSSFPRSIFAGSDFIGAKLNGSDFSESFLRDLLLRAASARNADFSGATLSGANLTEAHLQGANLRRAHLRGADLTSADLSNANLRDADLTGADLARANLAGACLQSAHLERVYLSHANLEGVDLTNARIGERVVFSSWALDQLPEGSRRLVEEAGAAGRVIFIKDERS